MAELGSLFTGSSGESSVPIEIEMLDFDYVKNCGDIQILKGIVKRLQSGEDGHYPDLLKTTEARLMELLPLKEKRRVERLHKAASIEEINEAEQELCSWLDNIDSKDKSIASTTNNSKHIFESTNVHQVPVRGTKTLSTHDSTIKLSSGESKSPIGESNEKQRISGYDFRAWDKFDAESAVGAMDAAEEGRQRSAAEIKAGLKSQAESTIERRQLHHKNVLRKLREESDWGQLSEASRTLIAERERHKGNESFKAKEFETAFDCYTRSVSFNESSVAYANRAMAAIKLERYDLAVDDCTRSLNMDPTYYKALIRRGTAYTYTGQYGKAIDDFTCAMNLCPLGERGSLSKLLDKARSKFLDSEGIEHSSTADRAPPIPPVISAIDLDMAKEIEESIPIVRISSLDEVVDTRRYKFLQMGICETSYTAETFTRIAISDDDDDDDDEQEVVEECNNTTMGQFTRVTISEDDDDEEEEADVDDTEGEWAALVAEGDTASVDIYGSLQETVSSLQDAGHHDEAVSFIRESQQGISSLTQGQRTDLLQALTISLSALARYNEVITICTEALEADSSLAWAYLGRAHAYKLTGNTRGIRGDIDALSAMAQSSPAADALETWLVAESCRLKDLGNAAAGISDHSEAVRLYSASLEADQSNLKARNNRAQMLLSLSRYEECVQDVVEVLKFEPDNVKAIFRAGQAYEGLNRLQDAEDMYSRVLAIDSRHVSAINLKNKLHDKIKANRPTQSLTPTAKELSKAPKVSGEIKSKISITGASELKDSHTSLTESKELPVRAERIESKVARKVQGMTLKPEVPDVPPTTVYELERVWRGLRGRADLFAKYLCIFKKVTFKKVFKEAVSHDLIGSVFIALHDHISDLNQILFILEGFTHMEKMTMTMALLPEEDLKRLKSIVSRLESDIESGTPFLIRVAAIKKVFSL